MTIGPEPGHPVPQNPVRELLWHEARPAPILHRARYDQNW